MEYLNGQAIPKDCAIDELQIMLESLYMQTFALACEALKNMQTTEAL